MNRLDMRKRKMVAAIALTLNLILIYIELKMRLRHQLDSSDDDSDSDEEEDTPAPDSASVDSNLTVNSRPAKRPRLQAEDAISETSRHVQRVAAISSISKELSVFRQWIEKTVETVVKKLTGEDEESVRMRNSVIDDVGKLPGLSRDEVIGAAAAMSVASDNRWLKFFYSLKDDNDRLYFVKKLLKD
ncbi:hypothetical protein LINPERHAP2_LOCUS31205 [Linum perenne]